MIDNILDSLNAKLTEQKYLLDLLALRRHVAKAGFPSKEVHSFSFRPEFMTCPSDKRASDTHYNCVRLNDGTLRKIPLYPIPRKQLCTTSTLS